MTYLPLIRRDADDVVLNKFCNNFKHISLISIPTIENLASVRK